MVNRAYKRVVVTTLARPLSGSQLNVTQLPPNATVVKKLDMKFTVEKHLGKEPNTAQITIYNAAEATRREAQIRPLYVRIDAGYDGRPERLFTGDLRHGFSVIDGPDWVTELELADGERTYRYARVSRSYRAGISAGDAIIEIAKSMGLGTSQPTPQIARLLAKQSSGGLTLSGRSSDELSRMLNPLGLTWSIQDGFLQILTTDSTRAGAPILISEENGMVGSPEVATPRRKGKPALIHVKTLLNPRLTPGGRINLQSRSQRGLGKILKVTHTGDTAGNEFYSDVEARPL